MPWVTLPPLSLPTRRDTDLERTDHGLIQGQPQMESCNSSALLGRGHTGSGECWALLWKGGHPVSENVPLVTSPFWFMEKQTPHLLLISPFPFLFPFPFPSQSHPRPGLSTKGSSLSLSTGTGEPRNPALPRRGAQGRSLGRTPPHSFS